MRFKQQPGIYSLIIKGTVTYKYIGQSVNISTRIRQHKNSLKKNKHYNSYMQNAYNKYQNIEFKVLYYPEEVLTIMEQTWINIVQCENCVCLNLTSAFSKRGYCTPENVKYKISQAHKTSEKAKAAREKLYAKRRKEGLSPEHFKNVCIANAKRKGISHTKETKNKMSKTRSSNLKLLEQARQLGLSTKGENNSKYQYQEYIFKNFKTLDIYEGTRVNFRNYLDKSHKYNGNLTKLLNVKQKTFFGYKLIACKLPYCGSNK
jgi:hypothetical protein